MPAFQRYFDCKSFINWYRENSGSAVHELFARWARPGEPTEEDRMLRLAVRGGYLNFYVMGQSVAKISCGPSGPRASVHNAYVTPREEGTSRNPTTEQSYVEFSSEKLADPATAMLVAEWVKEAESYASAEKRFVDELVGANPGTIDLEMGLPASDLPGAARVAPRMDLVLVELDGDAASLVFWEAKCANNGELRAKGEAEPKVRGQLARYTEWMKEEGRIGQVAAAYQETAKVLRTLHATVSADDAPDPACLKFWTALEKAMDPRVVIEPALVIGNYWPKGSTEGIASERMRQCSKTFESNGHRAKLESAGVIIHQVGPNHRQLVLPHLAAESTAA